MKRIDIVKIIEEYEVWREVLTSQYPPDRFVDETSMDYRKRKIKEYNEWLKGEV